MLMSGADRACILPNMTRRVTMTGRARTHSWIAIGAAVMWATPTRAQYGNSAADELYYRHQAETREMARQDWVASWARTNNAVMWEEFNKRKALEHCRKAPGGCHSRFSTRAGAPTGPGVLAASMTGSPEMKQQLTVTAAALLDTYRQVAITLGLPRNEVAAPMAYCFLTAMLIYNGQTPALTPRLLQRVTQQTRTQLANDGGMALTNDAGRRERSELLGIVGVYLNSEFRAATQASDAPRLTRLRRLAGSVVTGLAGVAPEQLTVTDAGVIASGRAAPPATTGGDAPGPAAVLNPTTTTRFAFDSGAMLNPRDWVNLVEFDRIVRTNGGDVRDLAWGATTAFGIYYFLLRDVRLTPRQLRGTSALARRLLLESDAVAASTERDRQQAYEKMASNAMQTLNSYRQNEKERAANNNNRLSTVNNAYALNQVADAIRTSAASSIDALLSPASLRDFNMTADGLVKMR
jgi:hypothetical protein